MGAYSHINWAVAAMDGCMRKALARQWVGVRVCAFIVILLSLTEISLDLNNKFVEREANFVSRILHHLAFHSQSLHVASAVIV